MCVQVKDRNRYNSSCSYPIFNKFSTYGTSFYASPLLSSRPYPQCRHPHHHPSTPNLPPPPPRQKKRKLISESEVYEKQLQASLGDLDRAKRQYEKTFKQSVVAAENWQKADADLNLSRFVNHKRQAGATSLPS